MKLGKFFTRFSIIFVWVLLIFLALYSPRWKVFPIEEKSLNVFAWGDVLEPEVLSQFEKETGIKINVSYYASNEELLVKMRATRGEGYDLIMPSNYTASLLIGDQLLQPLDKSKLNFWDDLNPLLLNHKFDLGNQYSIPFEWEIFGLGVDRNFFKGNTPDSWKAIFDSSVIDYKIAFKNDPLEAVNFAAFYLYGKNDDLTEDEFEGVRQLLLNQRRWVEAYTDSRGDYFIATGNCPVALSISALIKRIRLLFPHIDFVIPKEGSFISIENFCIPKASKKQNYAYKLLNYLYSNESAIIHHEKLWLLPATLSPIKDLKLEEYEKQILNLSREDFEKFHFIKKIYPYPEIQKLWVEVKSF